MQKTELIACVGNVLGNQDLAAAVVNATLEVILDAVVCGDDVTLPNFGTFKLVEKAARKGRNLATGAEIMIPARKAVKFVPAAALKKAMTDYTL